jgi:tetratricopeptide (TPR) repeat protein
VGWPAVARRVSSRLAVTAALVVAWALVGVAPLAGRQARAPLAQRDELVKLDALLAAGESAKADALLKTMAPRLAKDDRLAFDAIYVLLTRDRVADAKAQWNALAPRVQVRVKAAGESPTDADRQLLGEAMFVQGLLAARGGDRKDALQSLQRADGLGVPPLDSPLMLLAADTLFALQEHTLAVSAYREFLKRRPGHAAARASFGAALYATGALPEARSELEGVLRQSPKTPRASYTLGSLLFQLKEYDEARTRLQHELSLDPQCAPCLSRLAHIAYIEGDDASCRSWLDKARAIDASNAEVLFVGGALALRQGRYEEAVTLLQSAVEAAPDFSTARFQLATAYRRAGQPDKAREQLEIYQRLLEEQKAREKGVRGSDVVGA